MLTNKTLLSLGAAILGTKFAQIITQFNVDHALGGVGLARRRTHVPENLAFLGVGVFVGGVAGLLLAPRSGAETRAQLSNEVDKIGDATSRKLRDVREEVSGIAGRFSEEIANQQRS